MRACALAQLAMDMFTCDEMEHVSQLAHEIVSSSVVQNASAALWGDSVLQGTQKICVASRLVLEGGREQMPHADALFPNALVVLISMKPGQVCCSSLVGCSRPLRPLRPLRSCRPCRPCRP